jgi:hypothetical protein
MTHPIFIDDPQFDWPVILNLPQNGDWEEVTLQTCFRLIAAETIQKLLDQGDNAALMQQLVVSIMDTDNQPLNDNNRQRLLGYFPVQKAIINAYQQAIIGQDEKN